MGLTDIRAYCLEFSGRYDLEGSGFDKYINAGQKLLDRLLTEGKIKAKLGLDIASGEIFKSFKYCRAIEEVWVHADDTRYQLIPVTMNWLRTWYPDKAADITPSIPEYFAPAIIRPLGGAATTPEVVTPASFHQSQIFEDTVNDGAWQELNGIVWMPPSDGDYTLEIIGKFFSVPLDATNVKTSFWTENYPLVLAWAAMYYIEVSYRNTEGSKDWMAAIMGDVGETIKDKIEEEVYQSSGEMEG